jgi:hypothetical protein
MENTPEIWKDIPGYEGRYIVSNRGHVAVKMKDGSFKGRKLNTATPYPSFSVSNGPSKSQTCLYIHRLVSSVFIGQKPTGMVIRHIDGNKNNNCVQNLSYGFPEENVADDVKHGKRRGILNGRSKLDERDVKAIKSLLKDGVSLSAIARAFTVSVNCINHIHKNRQWKHVI